jgi:hypothetical protein
LWTVATLDKVRREKLDEISSTDYSEEVYTEYQKKFFFF